MNASLWIVLVCLHCCVSCYENLSRKLSTQITQSSTYNSYGANLANDGGIITNEVNCAHTALSQTLAWLQVDFGKKYTISSVKIYYRNEDAWQPYRFRQFYLDVSAFPASTSNTSQRTRCYIDNTTHPNVPPNIITIPCKHTARYVIVETTYDAPEDDPVAGAILEICELEVYGCGLGRYGATCTECPECSTCDIESGKCECSAKCKRNVCDSKGHCTDGCLDGFWTPNCNSSCPAYCKERNCIQNTGYCISCKTGYWGYTCTFVCSSHCLDGVCDIINGSCTHECTQGWYGDTCDNACSPGCVGGTCDKHSGTCNAGCKQNLTGHQCDVCDATHYGFACSLGCSSNCLNNTCDNITGSCILTGDCQVGKFGEMCRNICSEYCRNGCLKVTGICRDGCNVGKFGEFCNETCDARHKACCNQDTRKYKQSHESNTESILYAVIAVLCTSFVINVYTITWILRNNACKKRDVIPDKAKRDTEFIPTTGIYDIAEDNAGYQELDQLSVPSHYSQLQNPTNN